MSNAIRESITNTFGFEPICINSALVSAQNRQRLYWVGKRNFNGTYSRVHVDQPEDRGILLRDVLDRFGAKELSEREMAYMVRQTSGARNHFDFGYIQNAAKDKSACLTANVSKGVPYNVCCEPVCMRYERSEEAKAVRKQYERGEVKHGFRELSELHPRVDGKSNTISTVLKDNPICEPVMAAEPCHRVGTWPNKSKNQAHDSQQYRIYSTDGKGVTLCGNGGGMGAKTGLYAIPVEFDGERPIKAISCTDGKTYTVYEVKDGQITVRGKPYPIKLTDGYYIVRKLTVTESMRLQTVPEWYDFCVISNSQAYKCLGNGWTCDVITHLINATQKAACGKWLDELLGDCS
jgi:DNA (cytosine-5)-methyltransferase 3A